MCVIVYKPSDVKIDEADLTRMWEKNHDGAGIAYFNADETITIEKGIMKLGELKERIAALQDSQLALHFRYATHGKKNEEMTHPFEIDIDNEGKVTSALFHNGILSQYGSKDISDTCDFVCTTLTYVPDEERGRLLESLTGKFLLMQDYTYFMYGSWEKHNGLSVSNINWKPVSAAVYYPTRSYTSTWSANSHNHHSNYGYGYGYDDDEDCRSTVPVTVAANADVPPADLVTDKSEEVQKFLKDHPEFANPD